MSIVAELTRRGLIGPPSLVLASGRFEVKMGSWAFGTASSDSDVDVYGFFVPPQEVAPEAVADELRILHLVVDGTEHDIVLFSLDKFFERCVAGRSQSIETLFADESNIIAMGAGACIARDNRKLFLTKQAAREFRNFAKAQLDGLVGRSWTDGKRGVSIARFGYDVKAGYHIVRLMHEAKQILVEGDLDLKRNSEMLREIRSGAWTEADVVACFERLDAEIEQLLQTSNLPEFPQPQDIATLLHRCRTATQSQSSVGPGTRRNA